MMKAILAAFILFILCHCGYFTFSISDTDISKMEAYQDGQAVSRPYKILGSVSKEGCPGIWEAHSGIENNPDYTPDPDVIKAMLGLARLKYGEQCDAVINIKWIKNLEHKYMRCSSPGMSGNCKYYRWCYKTHGDAVSWLDKPKPKIEKDLPESAHEPWPKEYWKYDKAISKIGEVWIVKPTMDAIVSALRGKFVEADIPMSKWNPDWAVIVYVVAVDNQLNEFMPSLYVQNGQIYFDTSKVDIPQSLDWLYASLDCKSEKKFQDLAAEAKQRGSKFFKYLESREAYEKYKANFEKRLEKRFRVLLKGKGKKEKKVSRRAKFA